MSHRFIPGIASQSLGCPKYHNLHDKLKAAARADLRSIEIFFEDIAKLADTQSLDCRTVESEQSQFTYEQQTQLACARQIRQWCAEAYPGAHSIDIICLQPFMHFEGLLDLDERGRRFEKLHFWIEVAKNLGTDLIQIPSNFLPESECTSSRERVVEDLREAATIGAAQNPPIRFAHEALCWGTHTDLWDEAWAIVKEVDMPNFGTCLDTFNLAGRVYADPTRRDGKTQNADVDIARSIQKLRDTFSDPENLKKVFYVELCDGETLDAPISQEHEWYDAEQKPRMSWSRNARLYPFESDPVEATAQGRKPGYLPVTDIFDALLDVGYEGYLSFEVFNRSLNKEDGDVIDSHAARAATSWRRCAAYIDRHFADCKEPVSPPDSGIGLDEADFDEAKHSTELHGRVQIVAEDSLCL